MWQIKVPNFWNSDCQWSKVHPNDLQWTSWSVSIKIYKWGLHFGSPPLNFNYSIPPQFCHKVVMNHDDSDANFWGCNNSPAPSNSKSHWDCIVPTIKILWWPSRLYRSLWLWQLLMKILIYWYPDLSSYWSDFSFPISRSRVKAAMVLWLMLCCWHFQIYINCPGGSTYSVLAIYDCMSWVSCAR